MNYDAHIDNNENYDAIAQLKKYYGPNSSIVRKDSLMDQSERKIVHGTILMPILGLGTHISIEYNI